MSPNVKAIPLIVLGVLLNAAAQICLKKGLQAAGGMQLAGMTDETLEPAELVIEVRRR